MTRFLRKRWPLLLVLIVFIICKIPHLFYPFYSDECWVYAPAIKEMYRNGISLLPNAIDIYLSRGHPMFFHIMGALWMHLFGGSNLSLHSFALFISILFLVSIYEAGLRFFNMRVAVLSILLVCTQVIFFVQSSFVLFEILIPLLVFLSLYFYSRDKYLKAAVCLTLLFLTKESGMIAGFVIGLDALAGIFNSKTELKTRLLRLAPVSVACLVILAFFICQKYMNGWYLFPSHMESILARWSDYVYRFRVCSLRVVFHDNQRQYLFLLLVIISIIAAGKNKKPLYALIIIPAVLVYILVDDGRTNSILPPGSLVYAFAALIISFCATVYYFSRSFFGEKTAQHRFVFLTGLFIICFTCFSAAATFTNRYMLAALLPLLFLVAVFMDQLTGRSYKWIYYLAFPALGLTAFFSFRENNSTGDDSLGAFYAMDVQKRVVRYMEDSSFYDKNITAISFLTREHLTNKNTGFLHQADTFKHVLGGVDSNTQILILDNIEPYIFYDSIKNDTSFHMIYRTTRKQVWAEIYRRQ